MTRAALYYKNEGVQQTALPLGGSDARDLRVPELIGPFNVSHELIGAELVIDYGLGGRSNIVLPECNVDQFSIDPQQGGAVHWCFRVACHPDEKQSGKLAMMIGKDDIKISVTPPSADDMGGAEPPEGTREQREPANA